MSGLAGALFQPYMNIRLATGAQFETRIIERPGAWMTPPELAALSEELTAIAARTLPRGSLDYGVFSGRSEAMARSIITLVRCRKTQRPVAFNALALMEIDALEEPVTVVHLGLVMVDPEVQSRGLSWVLYGLTCFLLFLRNQMRPLWISNVTQVPAVVGMVGQTFSNVFPTPQRPRQRSLQHLLLARAIMRSQRHVFGVGPQAGFDEERFVITDAYTGGSDNLRKSYQDAPKHRDPAYNHYCRDNLNYTRGDDVLQLGQIDLSAAGGYLRSAVPRSAIGGVVLAGVLLVVQRLILPVLHWFDTSRPFGALRARQRQTRE